MVNTVDKQWRSAGRGLAAWVMLTVGLPLAAQAVPLPPEDCEKLTQEHGALAVATIKERMAQGPAWGKANLSSSQLKEIERYIQLEEQLLFRCGQAKARSALPVAEEDAVAPPPKPAENGAGKAATAASGDAPAPAPKPKAAKKAAAKPAVEATPSPDPAVPAKQPRPKPKAKVDDAFRPEAAAQPSGPAPAPGPVR